MGVWVGIGGGGGGGFGFGGGGGAGGGGGGGSHFLGWRGLGGHQFVVAKDPGRENQQSQSDDNQSTDPAG